MMSRRAHTSPEIVREARCQCGEVSLIAERAPIMTVACYCASCQQAGQELNTLEPDSGTSFILFRKDRVDCGSGHELLQERRLLPESKTRRVVASCCGCAMFLEFEKGHWLSLYLNRFAPNEQPAIEMRTMTVERRPGVEFDDAIPSPKKHSFRFMKKLLTAWIAMGFRVPKIDYVELPAKPQAP